MIPIDDSFKREITWHGLHDEVSRQVSSSVNLKITNEVYWWVWREVKREVYNNVIENTWRK